MTPKTRKTIRGCWAYGACATGLAVVLASSACTAQDTNLEVVLSLNHQPLYVEVANTEASREQGLAHRRMLGEDSGMLFVFPQPDRYSMWMKQTYVALSVAFLDEQGVIINIEDMAPNTLVRHAAARPAKYALEANRGWFAARGIKPGMPVEGVGNVPAAR